MMTVPMMAVMPIVAVVVAVAVIVVRVAEVVVMMDPLAVHVAVVPAVVVVVGLAPEPDEQNKSERAGRAERRQKPHGLYLSVPENDRSTARPSG